MVIVQVIDNFQCVITPCVRAFNVKYDLVFIVEDIVIIVIFDNNRYLRRVFCKCAANGFIKHKAFFCMYLYAGGIQVGSVYAYFLQVGCRQCIDSGFKYIEFVPGSCFEYGSIVIL